MINIHAIKRLVLLLGKLLSLSFYLTCLFTLVFFSNISDGKELKYKKQTNVDFEEALVEGKSRKPYSSYLTQQKESAFSDLYEWSPDFDHANAENQVLAGRRP